MIRLRRRLRLYIYKCTSKVLPLNGWIRRLKSLKQFRTVMKWKWTLRGSFGWTVQIAGYITSGLYRFVPVNCYAAFLTGCKVAKFVHVVRGSNWNFLVWGHMGQRCISLFGCNGWFFWFWCSLNVSNVFSSPRLFVSKDDEVCMIMSYCNQSAISSVSLYTPYWYNKSLKKIRSGISAT